MYKPPENTNRVKAIKSKFENASDPTRTLPSLSRQLSDPIKVNIKRTPAFRNDKAFQRNGMQISYRVKSSENKSLKNCDNMRITPPKNVNKNVNNFNNLRKRFDSQEDLTVSPRGLYTRSNTSAEIILNKSRVCNNLSDNLKCYDSQDNLHQKTTYNILDTPKRKEEPRYQNLSLLYTEPIPRCLRNNFNNIHNASTLKIEDKVNNGPKSTNLGHNSCHDDIVQYKLNALTDTLKLALKKPLPPGPAPKKPPRTFVHSPKTSAKLSDDFSKKLNVTLRKKSPEKKTVLRGDPKYMLDKLENALKNNKIRLKRQGKVECSSEDENICESEKKTSHTPTRFNLNCLQGLSCSNATYDAIINDAKSVKRDEPVYAEPFNFPETRIKDDNKNRNSLYYMSSPVATSTSNNQIDIMENNNGLFHSNGGDGSSTSTPSTSDIDSVTSTQSEETKTTASPKIRELIKNFEHNKSKTMPNVDNRVEKLGRQLKDTIENTFQTENQNDISERSSTDGESNEAIVGKFETYVRTIRMFSKSRRKCDGKHLFYCCLLVGLNGRVPYIKFQFPSDVEVPFKIEELCFPDSADSTIDCSIKAQSYSIVITNNNGERIYGYCRRVLPENSQTCLPLAYCILSKQRASRFYRRILQELESRHGLPDKMRDILLNEFYYHRFPHPGETIRINLKEINKYMSETVLLDFQKTKEVNKENVQQSEQKKQNNVELDLNAYLLVNGGKGEYGSLNKKIDIDKFNRRNGVIFHNGIIPKDLANEYNDDLTTSLSAQNELDITLHEDSRYKETDLEELCNILNINILQKVFASLLLERKVVFISCLLGKLSTCIEAIQNMLYPFLWPHTLIPVVPKDLWEIVEAPTPLICGTLSLRVVNDFNIEDAIVVDLDEGAVLMEVGDEGKILPPSLVKEFKDGMSLAKNSRQNESGFNVLLSDAFLRIFIHSCGHYKNFIKDGHFQKEEFMQYPKRKSVKRFLKWFTETTMFCTFIDTVLADTNSFSIFDKRIQIYSSQDATLILEKMKDWKKEKSNTLFF